MLFEQAALALKRPSPRTLDAFRNVFNNVHPSRDPYPTLGGHGARFIDDTSDLVSLCQPSDEDRLTSFIRHYLAFILVVRLASNSTCWKGHSAPLTITRLETERRPAIGISLGEEITRNCRLY